MRSEQYVRIAVELAHDLSRLSDAARDPARSDAGFSADGRPAFCPEHRGGLPCDVAAVVCSKRIGYLSPSLDGKYFPQWEVVLVGECDTGGDSVFGIRTWATWSSRRTGCGAAVRLASYEEKNVSSFFPERRWSATDKPRIAS